MVTIWGKPGCGKCDALKRHLVAKRLRFFFVDLFRVGVARYIDGADDAMAYHSLWDDLPVCEYQGGWYRYPELMAKLRAEGRI